MILLERTREGHHQSDEHWNRFKGNVGETSERRGGAHMGIICVCVRGRVDVHAYVGGGWGVVGGGWGGRKRACRRLCECEDVF